MISVEKVNTFERALNKAKTYSTYIIFLLLFLICVAISTDFLTPTNIVNIGRQYAALTAISMGMLFVILTGGIDLSVGSIAALGSVMVSTSLAKFGFSLGVSIIIAILSGLLLGLITGLLIAYANMAAFIASMAMMTIARGAAFIISNGSPIPTPANSINSIGVGTIFGVVPILVVIAAIMALLFWFILNYTSYGRIIIAIGSNVTAVRLAGIRNKFYVTSVYVLSGACSAIAGVIIASRTAIGSPVVGSGMELDAIAACVIGGASLSGGEGSPIKTVVGVLVLALIGNIMNLLAVPSYPQDVIKGVIIITSVLLQSATASVKKDS